MADVWDVKDVEQADQKWLGFKDISLIDWFTGEMGETDQYVNTNVNNGNV
jgi:hypothetical protein